MGIRRGNNSPKDQITQDFFSIFVLITKLNTYTASKSGEPTTHTVMPRLLGRDRAKQPLSPQFLIPSWNLSAWSPPKQV